MNIRILAVVVTLALVGGFLVALLTIALGGPRKPKVPPNLKPYVDDDQLEGPVLEKALAWAVVLTAFLALAMGVYFLREPGREAGAFKAFDEESIARGEIVFGPATAPGGFGCQNCHGVGGVGGSAPFGLKDPVTGELNQVTWTAPSLNDVFLRYSTDEIRTIVVYGRPNTPMPPWGLKGGGSLNDQQVEDVINYIRSIQITPAEARKKQEGVTDPEELFKNNCARCHTYGWSYATPEQKGTLVQGNGSFGPSLLGGTEVDQFPNPVDHVTFVTEGDEFQKPYGVRGVGQGRMPAFGKLLTRRQIEAIVQFERGL